MSHDERRFRDFAEIASDWFWETDENHRFTYLSGRYEEVGLDADEWLGKTRCEITADNTEQQSWRDHLAELAAHRPFKNFQHSTLARDGCVVHVTVSGKPISDGAGAFKGYRGTASDITDRVKAEEELRAAKNKALAAEAQLDEALEAMSEGFAYFDAEDRLVRCNSKHRELFPSHADFLVPGARFEYLLRKQVQNIRLPWAEGREEEWIAERVKQHRDPGESIEQEFVDGRIIRLSEYKTRSGGIVSIRADITELKVAESALKEREARLRGIMDNVVDGIITFDEHGIIDSFNHAAEVMFGHTAECIRGQNVSVLMPEPHHSEHDDYIENYLHSEKGKILGIEPREVMAVDKDGSIFPMELAVSVMDIDGSRRFIGVLRDITQRKEIEEQLRQAQKMEAVGHLTGGIAHDFNNLLTTIIGNLDLVKDHIEENPEAQSFMDAAFKASLRGADLTQRLLAFSRKQALCPEPTDVNRLVPGMTELMRRTLGEDIQIETVLAGGLWHAMVDPGQLENALLNLAINARDAMPEGGKLTIETANTRLDQDYAGAHQEVTPGQYVMVAVTDTGTGMPPKVIERAFEPFFTTKEVGKGSGLGLSMIYGFVKQSGGHVAIYSELARGTTVRLYLPKATDAGLRAHIAQASRRNQPRGHETILVVEDDPDVRAFVVAALRVFGYQVNEAEDGPTALVLLDELSHIDLLLTDVVLPRGMNGRQVAEEVQKRLPQVKVLYTSGYTENVVVHHGRLDEDAKLLAKPYTRETLAIKVRSVLDAPDD